MIMQEKKEENNKRDDKELSEWDEASDLWTEEI